MRKTVGFLVVAALCWSAPSHAQNKSATAAQIRQTQALVLENYDLGDYEGAKKQLLNAIVKAEQVGIDGDLVNAKSHAMLAGVYLLGFRDEPKAIEHFKVVLGIAPGYELQPPFHTEPVKRAMAKADAILNPVITCESLRGIDHKQISRADEGSPIAISFKAGPKLRNGSAQVFYRTKTGREYAEVELRSRGQCEYAGEIPGTAVTGELMYYFVSMRKKDDGRFIAMRGNHKSPYPITVAKKVVKAKVLERQTKNEVPDELNFGTNNKPKGGGCAGCAGTSPSGFGATLLLFGGLALVRRRIA